MAPYLQNMPIAFLQKAFLRFPQKKAREKSCQRNLENTRFFQKKLQKTKKSDIMMRNFYKKNMKYSLKKAGILFGFGCLMIGGLWGGMNSLEVQELNAKESEKNADPLAAIFQVISGNPEYKADFTTDTLKSYSGPKSDALKNCIATAPKSAEKQLVYGEYNQAAVVNQTTQEILDEINPVFGHAVRNSEINWVWDGVNHQYTFKVAKGEESLWWCYFRNETNFFKNFFKQDKMQYGLAGNPSLLDSDSDGVTDLQETTDGTNKLDATSYKDSDRDKVPDVVEAKEGSNPMDKTSFRDSDTGGVPDYVEIIFYVKKGLTAGNSTNIADDARDTDAGGMADYKEILNGTDPKNSSDDYNGIVCTAVYLPVCGIKNNEKKTYSNICEMSKAAATKVSDGECTTVPVPVHGVCGSAHGSAASSSPTTNLCAIGTASSVSGSGPWYWSCAGINGGTNASCSADKTPTPVHGMCGSSNGTTVSSSPTTNLCAIGTASSVSGSGPWYWSCTGSNGGSSANCSAPKLVPSVDCKNGDALTKAICKGYQDILSRDPEYGGYMYWYTDLPKNGVTANDQGIINDFIRSAAIATGEISSEYCPSLACKIVKAYRDILRKAPDTPSYNKALAELTANATQAIVNTYVQNLGNTGGSSSPQNLGNCPANAFAYSANLGKQYSCTCLASQTTSGSVWGTDIYTSDSALCRAAVHAGYQQSGFQGTVVFEMLAGQSTYTGSTQKGITSLSTGAKTSSIRFVSGNSMGSGGGGGNTEFWVTGYVMPGRINVLKPEDYTLLSAINHVTAIPNPDGTLNYGYSGVSNPDAEMKNFVSVAHANNQEILFGVQWTLNTLNSVASWDAMTSATSRTRLVNEILAVVEKYDYDGVDLDLEPVDNGGTTLAGSARKQGYVAFVKELRNALNNPKYNTIAGKRAILAASTIGPLDAEPHAQLIDAFDQINVMTYDMNFHDGDSIGFDSPINGPYYTVDKLIQGMKQAGIPANKLGLGINFDVVCWTGKTGPGGSTAGVPKEGELSYSSMESIIQNATLHWDSTAQMHWFQNGNKWCNYNSPQSIAAKIAYAKKEGLGGVMIWEMGLDSSSRTLRKAVQDAIGGTTTLNTVNGTCGSANGTSSASAPTTNLCSSGTATSVSGAGPWTWSCAGINGGTNASCSVNKTGLSCSSDSMSTAVCAGYNRILNRTPDSGGLAYWVQDFKNRGISSSNALAIDINIYSGAKAAKEIPPCSTIRCKVIYAYETILGRFPEQGGYDYWSTNISSSASQELVNQYVQTSAFTWTLGSYGSCSATCGSGTQTASYYCKNNETGSSVADSKCYGSKPTNKTQSCNTQACAITYTCTTDAMSKAICAGYTRILNRTPDSGGLAYWVQDFKNRGISSSNALAIDINIYSGAKAAKEIPPCSTIRCKVIYAYETILGRFPEQGGYDYWSTNISENATQTTVNQYIIDASK